MRAHLVLRYQGGSGWSITACLHPVTAGGAEPMEKDEGVRSGCRAAQRDPLSLLRGRRRECPNPWVPSHSAGILHGHHSSPNGGSTVVKGRSEWMRRVTLSCRW